MVVSHRWPTACPGRTGNLHRPARDLSGAGCLYWATVARRGGSLLGSVALPTLTHGDRHRAPDQPEHPHPDWTRPGRESGAAGTARGAGTRYEAFWGQR